MDNCIAYSKIKDIKSIKQTIKSIFPANYTSVLQNYTMIDQGIIMSLKVQ